MPWVAGDSIRHRVPTYGGGFHLFARQEGQKGGAVSRLWHNAIPQINVSSFAQCVVIWIFGTAHFPLSLQGSIVRCSSGQFHHVGSSAVTSRLLVLASALAGSFSRLRFPRRLVGYFSGHRFSWCLTSGCRGFAGAIARCLICFFVASYRPRPLEWGLSCGFSDRFPRMG
jgi:hypothetical protein